MALSLLAGGISSRSCSQYPQIGHLDQKANSWWGSKHAALHLEQTFILLLLSHGGELG